MFCSNCGKELGDKMNFCPFCGTETQKLQKASAVPEITGNTEQKCIDEIAKANTAATSAKNETGIDLEKSGKIIDLTGWAIGIVIVLVVFISICFGGRSGECDHCGQNGRLTKFTNDSGSVSWYCEDCTRMAKLLS